MGNYEVHVSAILLYRYRYQYFYLNIEIICIADYKYISILKQKKIITKSAFCKQIAEDE